MFSIDFFEKLIFSSFGGELYVKKVLTFFSPHLHFIVGLIFVIWEES